MMIAALLSARKCPLIISRSSPARKLFAERPSLHAIQVIRMNNAKGGITAAISNHPQRSNFTAPPRVLMVNHGYPPQFNGGSEVYAQTLALQLLKSKQCADVSVMAREHDPFRQDFDIRRTTDQADSSLPVYLVNYPREAPYYQFISAEMDDAFRKLLEDLKPTIVHFHHLNHLSLNLPKIAREEFNCKTVYTLHDFWLMCPRGQFLVTGVTNNTRTEPWQQCTKQIDKKCATDCFTNRYATGDEELSEFELNYWTQWIAKRMMTVRDMCEHVDAFLSPSMHLQQKYIKDFHLPEHKIVQQPYGFDRLRLFGRMRIKKADDPLVFAYIGRHQPSKGINLLVDAALQIIKADPSIYRKFIVKIYGRADMNSTSALQRRMDEALPNGLAQIVFEWHNEYNNFNIVTEVFNKVDVIVVPSIWEENSPLVIHEAQQCGVPVITANHGGMGELVTNEVNGYTFEYRSASSLAAVMLKAINQPERLQALGKRGYLYSESGEVPCVQEHAQDMLQLYDRLLNPNIEAVSVADEVLTATTNETTLASTSTKAAQLVQLDAPWRITFDTNPDDCNFSCTMCEQHSEHSSHQKERKAKGIRRRRMDIELIRKTVAVMAPRGLREVIPTTMGEPLQYKEFPQILDICREWNVKLNLTTNGSFFGLGVDHWARLIVPVTVDVKISWNGATEVTQQKIMKGSNLTTQLSNLRRFIKIRDQIATDGNGNYCSVTLQLTFMEQNLHEIPAIVALAIETGCDRVKGHHLWAHFDQIADQNLRRSTDSIIRWNFVAKQCRDYALSHPLRSGKTLRLDNFFDLELSAAAAESTNSPIHPDAVCPFLGKEAWINHEGRFDPCWAPDEQRKSLGNFGNVTMPGQSLEEIWHGDKYKDLVSNYLTKPLCHSCNMRQPPR